MDRSAAQRLLRADQVAVGVLDQDLADSRYRLPGAVPPLLDTAEQRPARRVQASQHSFEVRDSELEVDPTAQRCLQSGGDPRLADTGLVQHEVSVVQYQVGKALVETCMLLPEPQQVTPEPLAGS